MTQRKPVPKRKAKPKSALRLNAATQAAIDAALAPTMASLAKVSEAISARHREQLKDLTATLKALAEQATGEVVLMERPERAAIAHNLSAARVESPALVKADRAIQMGVDTYQDYVELPTRYLYSAEAERLLSLLTGMWRTAYYSPACNADTGKHSEACAHLERRLYVSKSLLAKELHGHAGGSQVAMVSKSLQELAKARHTYSRARTNSETKSTELLSTAEGEPILTYLRAGEGDTLASAAASRTLVLVLGERYHAQLMRGLYRVERTERLTCWAESWELELMLRLLTTPTTRYGSYAMNSGADSRSVKLLLNRTKEGTELGTADSLMSGRRSLREPAAITRRLQKFADTLRKHSEDYELQVFEVMPKREGRRIVGWYLGMGYKEPPLTAGQVKALARQARARLRAGEIPTQAQRAALARVQAYKPQEPALLAQSGATIGTKWEKPRHEVGQLTHETGDRLVQDSELDTTTAQEPKLTESEAETGDRLNLYRQEWATYGHSVRRALQNRHAELRDLEP